MIREDMPEFLLFSPAEIYSGDTPETLCYRRCDVCGDTVVDRPEIAFVWMDPDGLSLCEPCFFEMDLNP